LARTYSFLSTDYLQISLTKSSGKPVHLVQIRQYSINTIVLVDFFGSSISLKEREYALSM